MDQYERHRRTWRFLYKMNHWWICRKFQLRHEDLHLDGPFLLVPNHVCAWDPLLVAMSFPDKPLYFVASEHLFRLGFITKLLNYLVEPIPRRKGVTGSDTAKACLRHLKAGRSVCIFGEGEQTWDGKTAPIFPATGKLARISGASLVTYRLEGGFLSLPRWGRGQRKGQVFAHPVHVYRPEELRSMTPAQIDAAIQRDITEDAWERQREAPIPYRGRYPAERLERAVYLCPRCKQISRLHSKGDRVFCDCGFSLRYTDQGFFDPPTPFEDLSQWDTWQQEQLYQRAFQHPAQEGLLFADDDMRLTLVEGQHREKPLGQGRLELYEDRLCIAGRAFPLKDIENMAIVQTHLLMFSYEGQYWEIRSLSGANLRKYLYIWKER